jgi:hypothetical protein
VLGRPVAVVVAEDGLEEGDGIGEDLGACSGGEEVDDSVAEGVERRVAGEVSLAATDVEDVFAGLRERRVMTAVARLATKQPFGAYAAVSQVWVMVDGEVGEIRSDILRCSRLWADESAG